jgi:DNA-directed RNA polymerase specialized sigma24 family protein
MLGALSDAEDLVQETLLRAWEKRATLTSPEAYRAWLYRIATNLCLNMLNRVPRRSLPLYTHPQSDAGNSSIVTGTSFDNNLLVSLSSIMILHPHTI